MQKRKKVDWLRGEKKTEIKYKLNDNWHRWGKTGLPHGYEKVLMAAKEEHVQGVTVAKMKIEEATNAVNPLLHL